MKHNHATVVVDLKSSLDVPGIGALASELRAMDGVTRAHVSTKARRLFVVEYDTEATCSRRILGAVMRRGFDARLIGM